MARLDRLVSARIAQLGAVIGRQFSFDLLRAVSQLDETTLHRELGQLLDAELVYRSGVPPQETYLFKHALVQDAAYQSLLRSTRRVYHRRIAEVLVERFPEVVKTQPELPAHHFTAAGLNEEAIGYWQQAGELAIARSANQEAIHHLTRGLDLLGTLPVSPARTQHELVLLTKLGPALMAAKGYADADVEATYERARELCQEVEQTPQLFPVLWGLWLFSTARARHRTARVLGEQLLGVARHVRDDAALLLEAHHAL
jgi:predicted ATPase